MSRLLIVENIFSEWISNYAAATELFASMAECHLVSFREPHMNVTTDLELLKNPETPAFLTDAVICHLLWSPITANFLDVHKHLETRKYFMIVFGLSSPIWDRARDEVAKLLELRPQEVAVNAIVNNALNDLHRDSSTTYYDMSKLPFDTIQITNHKLANSVLNWTVVFPPGDRLVTCNEQGEWVDSGGEEETKLVAFNPRVRHGCCTHGLRATITFRTRLPYDEFQERLLEAGVVERQL